MFVECVEPKTLKIMVASKETHRLLGYHLRVAGVRARRGQIFKLENEVLKEAAVPLLDSLQEGHKRVEIILWVDRKWMTPKRRISKTSISKDENIAIKEWACLIID